MEGNLRFGKHRKLSPNYIGPYEIIERVGPLAYWLVLPQDCQDSMMCSMFLWFEDIDQIRVM